MGNPGVDSEPAYINRAPEVGEFSPITPTLAIAFPVFFCMESYRFVNGRIDEIRPFILLSLGSGFLAPFLNGLIIRRF